MLRRLSVVHLYLVAGLIIAIAAIGLVMSVAAARQDRQAIADQQVIVSFETQEVYGYLQGQVRQMIYWQDAFDKIVRTWDETWIAYQFGTYQKTMGDHLVALIDPKGDIRFLHQASAKPALTPTSIARARGFAALLTATRRASLREPPPISTGLLEIAGTTYFAAAAYVTPEAQEDMAYAKANPYIAMFFLPVTPQRYAEFSEAFEHARIGVTLSREPTAETVRYPLKDASGETLAWLEWKPLRPGTEFLRSAIIPSAGVLLVLALIQGLVILRWLSLQKTMLGAQARAESAVEESRLKSMFLGNVSHELRTPLNAIIGYSDALCSGHFGPLGSQKNTEYVHHILTSGRHLLRLVDDLIEIAQIESHAPPGKRALFDVTRAAREAIAALLPAAQARNVALTLKSIETHAWCLGSSRDLTHAFERVLSNAIKHSPAGATVTLDIRVAAGCVIVEIIDHGAGISKEQLEQLAKPFNITTSHFVASKRGLGLGLPIATGLVRAMGGYLTVDSEVATGTTVRIRLPMADPNLASLPANTDVSDDPPLCPGRRRATK